GSNGSDRLDKRVRLGIFEHESVDPSLHTATQHRRLPTSGKNQNSALWEFGTQVSGCVQSISARHRDVDDGDLRAVAQGCRYDFISRANRSDHIYVVLLIEQRYERLSE